jgi:hypothetical protein
MEEAPTAPGDHGGAWVGVAGGDLHVAQADAGIETGGGERVAPHVQMHPRARRMRALRASANALGQRDDDPFRPPDVGHPPNALVLAGHAVNSGASGRTAEAIASDGSWMHSLSARLNVLAPGCATGDGYRQ